MIHLYAPREWLERELEAMQTAFQLASLVLVIAWVALPLLLLGALTYARIVSAIQKAANSGSAASSAKGGSR